MIINAALGYFSRSAVVTGAGAILSDGKRIPTPEEVMEIWKKITSLENPKYFGILPEISGMLGPVLQ